MTDSVGVNQRKDGDNELTAPMPSPTTPPLSKTWVLPFLPVSMNKLYGINYRTKQVYMMPDARTFKSKAKLCIGNFRVSKDDRLAFKMDVHTNYYFLNGNLKKSDIQNLIKVVVDAVSERLAFDDSQIWSFSATKTQSTENCCYITLEKQNETRESMEAKQPVAQK